MAGSGALYHCLEVTSLWPPAAAPTAASRLPPAAAIAAALLVATGALVAATAPAVAHVKLSQSMSPVVQTAAVPVLRPLAQGPRWGTRVRPATTPDDPVVGLASVPTLVPLVPVPHPAALWLASATAVLGAVAALVTRRTSRTPCLPQAMAAYTGLQPLALRLSLAQAAAPAEAAAEPEAAVIPARPLRVLSGVQPTGTLTLGNYLGAIKQWVDLQNSPATKTESLFCVVDLHAITLEHDPKGLAAATRMAAAVYLAVGLDPDRVTIFVQSHVRAHTELAWLLTCACPMGWMERMIQFKEKSAKAGLEVGLGLFSYPVLMASDILLYQTDIVPVGEDQTQHIELTRDLARRFNDRFAKKMKKITGKSQVFREPKAQIVKEGARIMSLLDGTSKMSKSAVNDNSRINLLDPPDVIRNKLKRCKTDSFEGLEFDNPERPECTNLLTIYKAVTGKSKEEVMAEVASMTWGTFKPVLAEAVVAHLEPIQTRYHAIMAQPEYLDLVLADGARKASVIAERTLADAYAAMGFMPRPPTT